MKFFLVVVRKEDESVSTSITEASNEESAVNVGEKDGLVLACENISANLDYDHNKFDQIVEACVSVSADLYVDLIGLVSKSVEVGIRAGAMTRQINLDF